MVGVALQNHVAISPYNLYTLVWVYPLCNNVAKANNFVRFTKHVLRKNDNLSRTFSLRRGFLHATSNNNLCNNDGWD